MPSMPKQRRNWCWKSVPLKERGWHMTGTHDEAGLAAAIRKLALGS